MSVFGKYAYYFSSIFTLVFHVKPVTRVVSMFLGAKPSGSPEVEMGGMRFRVRSAMDIWSLKEAVLDHYYERCGFSIGDNWTIVDIGGGTGEFTLLAAKNHPSNRVIAFEPTPSSYKLLKENLKANQITNVEAYQQAVWSSNGEVVIDTGMGEPVQFTSTELKNGQPVSTGKVVVPGYSLETLLEQHGIQKVDLMKLDCEGAEYEILFKAPDSVLQRIDRIVMEYHDNAVEYTHEDMNRFLTGKGYRVKVYPNVVHSYLGYLSAAR